MNFLYLYAEENAILLPGRVPSYKDSKCQLLPSSTTKYSVWQKYLEASSSAENVRAVKYSTFTMIWRKYCPLLTVMKPMTDLCHICQQNSHIIVRAANKPEAEKTRVCKTMFLLNNLMKSSIHVDLQQRNPSPFPC